MSTTHDSTNPPAGPGNPSSPDSTGQWVIDKAKKSMMVANEAQETAVEALGIARAIKDVVGVPSNQALQVPGTGLLGAFERLSAKVDGFGERLDAVISEIQADRAAMAKRTEALLWAVKVVVGVILTAATTGGIAWFMTLHH